MSPCIGFEMEGFLECDHCHEESVLYLFDHIKKVIRFYANPHLEDEKIRHVFETKRVTRREQDNPDTYRIEMKCVSCGKWFLGYVGIPLDWEAGAGLGRLEYVYIPKEGLIAFNTSENEEPDGTKEAEGQ